MARGGRDRGRHSLVGLLPLCATRPAGIGNVDGIEDVDFAVVACLPVA